MFAKHAMSANVHNITLMKRYPIFQPSEALYLKTRPFWYLWTISATVFTAQTHKEWLIHSRFIKQFPRESRYRRIIVRPAYIGCYHPPQQKPEGKSLGRIENIILSGPQSFTRICSFRLIVSAALGCLDTRKHGNIQPPRRFFQLVSLCRGLHVGVGPVSLINSADPQSNKGLQRGEPWVLCHNVEFTYFSLKQNECVLEYNNKYVFKKTIICMCIEQHCAHFVL